MRKDPRPTASRAPPDVAEAPVCPHRPPCPGCPRFADSRLGLAARGGLEGLAELHDLPPVEVVDGPTVGFRHRARLAIRGRVGSPKLGLFESGSHRVVHIPNCSVQHALINRVAAVVRRSLAESRLTSYSDQAHLGLARYLQVVVERKSQSAQVVLVGNNPVSDPFNECFGLIRERLGADLHSLWYNPNVDTSNTIFGAEFQPIAGPAAVVERFGGANVFYPPGAFGQSNLGLAEVVIRHLRAQIPSGARVTEYHAGVGAIGLSVLAQVSELAMNELSPQSLHGMQLGIASLDAASRSKITVVPGPAGAASFAADEADVVIVDPPRKGLEAELTRYLCDRPPPRLLYVSCGLESFSRDAAALTAGGRLRLSGLTAYNLFPFTDHVELLGRFDRG